MQGLLDEAQMEPFSSTSDLMDLEVTKILGLDTEIRLLLAPIILDQIQEVKQEIEDLSYLLATSPMGQLESAITDSGGFMDDVESELNGL